MHLARRPPQERANATPVSLVYLNTLIWINSPERGKRAACADKLAARPEQTAPAATHDANANKPAMLTTAITIRPLIMVNVSSSILNMRHLIEIEPAIAS
jgi:hypothetical protein